MDRQDIDALLIGALYGELTPADEARLTAHLESHPTDRGALDDLKVARQAVLDSRIFAVQAEPPQAVSALLLQEAHRRAPKRVVAAEQKESWFYRFTRSFLAHPAMAAAAMLVLVLGGAGIVYMRKGDDQFAAKQVAAPEMAQQSSAASQLAPAATPPSDPAAGSGYTAGLYEGNAEAPAISAADTGAKSASDRWEGQTQALQAETMRNADEQTKLKKAAPSRGIAVSTEKGQVKELERARAKGAKNDDSALDFGDAAGAPSGGGAGASIKTGGAGRADGMAQGGYAQPPPPAQAAPSSIAANKPAAPRAPEPPADAKKAPAPAKVATSSTMTTTKPPADKAPEAKPEPKADPALIAWAKGEHARAVALAQKGECTAAAKVALSVSSRASEYYAQVMATDRALKQCAQYINAERDKEAEKSSKARAQKRTNSVDEAPASTK
jgi:hypothetical protein